MDIKLKSFLGESIKHRTKISDEFDVNDQETFIEWAYFLISKGVI